VTGPKQPPPRPTATGQRRPLYFRLLRVRHLRVRGWVSFLLFEGSFALGALLMLAEMADYWAIVAVPVAVAAMVKVNDVVARALLEPLGDAQLRTPGVFPRRARGFSPMPRPSRTTTWFPPDDAVADPAARPDAPVRGVAPAASVAAARRRRPRPGIREPEPPMYDPAPVETIVTNPPATGVDEEPTTPDRSDGPGHRSRGNQGRFAG
jgi:hypothetical protein